MEQSQELITKMSCGLLRMLYKKGEITAEELQRAEMILLNPNKNLSVDEKRNRLKD